MQERKVIAWITKGGKHIPIFEDSIKDSKDSIPRVKAVKNVNIREKQIAQAKAEADRLNGRSVEDAKERDTRVYTAFSNSSRNIPLKKSKGYVRGNTEYGVEKIGNDLYLRTKTGKVVSKYKIAYAKDDNKAHVIVPGFGVVNLKDDKNILNMLHEKRKHLI